MRVIVMVRAPARRGRDAFAEAIEIEADRIAAAPALPFMCGWHAETLRKFCKAVEWTATIKGD